MRVLLASLILFFAGTVCLAQPGPSSTNAKRLYSGTAIPTMPCSPGPTFTDFYLRTGTHVLYYCSAAPSTWSVFGTGGGVAATSTIVDDVTTNATMFPVWVTANTGNLPLKVSSTKFQWLPVSSQLGMGISTDTNPGISITGSAPLISMSDYSTAAGTVAAFETDGSTVTSKGSLDFYGSSGTFANTVRLQGAPSGKINLNPLSGTIGVSNGALGTGIGSDPSHAQAFTWFEREELLTIGAGATSVTTMLIPAKAVVLSVSTRVTTVIPVAATFTVTVGGTTCSTGAISTAATTTDPGTFSGAFYNSTAQGVTITPNTAPLANTGRVRVTVVYYVITPPTS